MMDGGRWRWMLTLMLLPWLLPAHGAELVCFCTVFVGAFVGVLLFERNPKTLHDDDELD